MSIAMSARRDEIGELRYPIKILRGSFFDQLPARYPLWRGMPLDGAGLPSGQNGDRPFQTFSGEPVTPSGGNRFEDFFADDAYVSLKNHLYSYLLRRRAVRKHLQTEKEALILEIGTGLSPMAEASDRVVYSELSFQAIRTLKRRQGRGYFVVTDATRLPFKEASFSQVIASEVLEHIPGDRLALREIASVMKPGGSLILTFPHRRFYFAVDDRFTNHLRRYELDEMKANLDQAGLETVEIEKVLGPLEKITMMAFTPLISLVEHFRKEERAGKRWERAMSSGFAVSIFRSLNRLFAAMVWLDARLAPRCLSSVLLIRAVRRI